MQNRRSRQRLVFGATGWALDFQGCEAILKELPSAFRGWRIRVGAAPDFPGTRPRGTISRLSEGWHWREQGAYKAREWEKIPPKTPMRVITDVHDVAIFWYLDEHPDYLCLHGGAVKIGKGLVCFPAKGRTGKSTLIANLAARGHQVYCDDVLGLAPPGERGVALGLQPRLRVPLAPILKPDVLKFIAAHSGPTDRSWHYLKLGRGQLASLGDTAPVTAFVILDRQATGAARFSTATTAEVLKNIIAENIVRKLPMEMIFARLLKLASTRQRLRLTYSDPDEACELLAREFS